MAWKGALLNGADRQGLWGGDTLGEVWPREYVGSREHPGPRASLGTGLRVRESRSWGWRTLSKMGLVLDEAQRSAPPLISAHSKSKNTYC